MKIRTEELSKNIANRDPRKVREGKSTSRRKMEGQLEKKDVCGVWRGLKTISGLKKPDCQAARDQKWTNDLTTFFNTGADQSSAPPPVQTPMLQPPFSAPISGGQRFGVVQCGNQEWHGPSKEPSTCCSLP